MEHVEEAKAKKRSRRTEAKRTNADGTEAGGGKEAYEQLEPEEENLGRRKSEVEGKFPSGGKEGRKRERERERRAEGGWVASERRAEKKRERAFRKSKEEDSQKGRKKKQQNQPPRPQEPTDKRTGSYGKP